MTPDQNDHDQNDRDRNVPDPNDRDRNVPDPNDRDQNDLDPLKSWVSRWYPLHLHHSPPWLCRASLEGPQYWESFSRVELGLSHRDV